MLFPCAIYVLCVQLAAIVRMIILPILECIMKEEVGSGKHPCKQLDLE